MGEKQLGRLQFRIMQVLWDARSASAREITEALNQGEEVAHSTVQTLLRQLEAKGAVGHEENGRTFVFFPKIQEARTKRSAVQDLLERVFNGNVGSFVAHLLRDENLSRKELQEIQGLIDEKRKS